MKIPFLKNFRRGFATNSSSSHSFVYLKEASPIGQENPGRYISNGLGWEDFRLDTLREKLFYILVGRIGGGWRSTGNVDEDYEIHHKDFPELSREDFVAAESGYIDHESVGLVTLEEARDPHVAIFGGNDNDGYSEELIEAIRNGEVDWTRTAMDLEYLEHVPADDKEGQEAVRKYLVANPWAARSFNQDY